MTICVSFSVTSHTRLGQNVYICGNSEVLGNWDFTKALRLTTDESIYPEWKSIHPVSISPNSVIEFKIFIQTPKGELSRWESIPENRFFCLSEPSMVILEMNNPAMNFYPLSPEDPQVNRIPVRKGTTDILCKLEDEYSDSSSGNQRRWDEMQASKEREGSMFCNVFVDEAKRLFQNASTNDYIMFKTFHQAIQESDEPKRIHDIVVIPKNFASSQMDKQNRMFKKSSSKFIVKRMLDFKEVDLQQLEESPELNAFHFLFNIDNSQYIDFQYKFNGKGLLIFHLNPSEQWDQKADIIEKLLERSVCEIFCSSKQEQISLLVNYCAEKGYQIKVIRDHVIRITIQKMRTIYLVLTEQEGDVLFNCHGSTPEKAAYLKKTTKLIYHGINLPFPCQIRIREIFSNTKDLKKKKICLIARCDKISSISQKTINDLIIMSSKKNIQVYFLTNDTKEEVQKKIVTSHQDKFITIQSQGELICCENKVQNLLSSLSLFEAKYHDIYNKILDEISCWKKQILSFQINASIMDLEMANTTVGRLLAEYVEKKIQHKNQNTRYKLFFEKKIVGEKVYITLKPFILSDFFITRIIASINDNYATEPIFLCFDFERDKKNFDIFNECLKIACKSKNIKLQSFYVKQIGQYDSKKIKESEVHGIFEKIYQATQQSSIISLEEKKSCTQNL